MAKDDLAVVVDDEDNIIGYKASGKTKDQRIRITAIWLKNSQDQILIAQRSSSKWLHPLKWGPAAAGTVEKGESYLVNAEKELEEEIGVNDVALQELTKQFYEFETGKRVCMWYQAIIDWPIDKFTLQEDEVEQIKWVDKAWLKQDLAKNPDHYVPSAQTWIKLFNL